MDMAAINSVVNEIDSLVWGPIMLTLLVGTGVYLTCLLKFRTWRNLPYAIGSVLSKEARTKKRGTGDVSPFSALMTALAATIGTGNIVGVATAMFAGGLALWSGCGSPPASASLRNSLNVCWLSSTAKSMRRAK